MYNGRMFISDGDGRETAIAFNKVNTFVPSTLLSRWCNFHLQEELKTLEHLASVEADKFGWKFIEGDDLLFGLSVFKGKSGKLKKVLIDDSIGMRSVANILKQIGYEFDCVFDEVKGKMKEINLFKRGSL